MVELTPEIKKAIIAMNAIRNDMNAIQSTINGLHKTIESLETIIEEKEEINDVNGAQVCDSLPVGKYECNGIKFKVCSMNTPNGNAHKWISFLD